MKRFLIILTILFLSIMASIDYKCNQYPFPQFTTEEMQQICLQEGI